MKKLIPVFCILFCLSFAPSSLRGLLVVEKVELGNAEVTSIVAGLRLNSDKRNKEFI